MPILSRKDLERISRRVLFRYLTLSDRKMDRIDPVDFAEKICGLHFAFADMSVTGSILGLTSYSDVDLTISVPRGNGSVQEFHLNGNIAYVDQNLANAGSVGRLNFTLVHEAAHQILGMLYPEEYNPSAQPFICRLADERCTYPITDWVEWQTNVLTAYLLLPRELIDRYMDELGLGRQIKLLNKVFAPKEYALFSEMAKRLGVSKTALSIRLDNLGMISRNDFSDPYAPIHIYADDFDTAYIESPLSIHLLSKWNQRVLDILCRACNTLCLLLWKNRLSQYPHKSGCEKLLLQMPCKISCLFLRVYIGFVVVHTGCSKAHKSRCLCHACGAKRQCDGRHSNVYILDCIR